MRIVIILFFITHISATEHLSSLSKENFNEFSFSLFSQLNHSTVQSTMNDQAILESAIEHLTPKPKPFKADYGSGVVTTYLEDLTLSLLSYDVISSIVSTFTDEINVNEPEKRARIVVNTGAKSVKFRWLF